MLCVLCDKPLTAKTERGLTDCAHEFCLKCICRQLTDHRNLCPICDRKVKVVHQIYGDQDDPEQATAPAPASIRFNNAIYVLNVSIWAVADPARVLAELFHLEQARLIHKGKMLNKGDVWRGTVVQLFGTRKGTRHENVVATWAAFAPWNIINKALLQRASTILCCPCTVLFEFFRSLFVTSDRERRGYRRVDQGATAATGTTAADQRPRSFHEPGRVASPHLIDSAE